MSDLDPYEYLDEEPEEEATELHPGQSEVYSDLFIEQLMRFAVVVCSRGWGKSYLAAVAAVTAVFELLELDIKVPNKNVYIIAPTYDQVKDIYFPIIFYELGMENHVIKASKDTGRFLFPNNVELRLVSFEAVERLRGKGAYFVVGDEISSWKKGITPKEAWEGIIQPCIVTRWSEERRKKFGARSAGRALIISTPKGYNILYDMFHFQEKDSLWKSYHYDYHSSPFLDPAEIDRIRHTIDPIEFASEYLASFTESGNSVFYCFKRERNVDNTIADFHDTEDVHICIDFNVGLQCSSVFALRGKQMEFLDEFKGHPDTEQLAIAIATRYKGHKIYAYPDPSGKSRKTSAAVGRTDFSILESKGIRCLAHKKAPPIIDSVAAVNRMLYTAAGETHLRVHPRCEGTIKSLERTSWVDKNPDTAAIDKSAGEEHFSDGVRYGTEYLFPVLRGSKPVARGFAF
ncbi:MAG: hypothetical protein DRR06_09215 [Gammaproteobacteria bacterium]|nr:MAG: hypothetical protein DRR06_09215 [Gammaproteobacteria bacterium]